MQRSPEKSDARRVGFFSEMFPLLGRISEAEVTPSVELRAGPCLSHDLGRER